MGPLNLVVLPYLSRRYPDQELGELLFLITIAYFVVSAIGAPLSMSLYRNYNTKLVDYPCYVIRLLKYMIVPYIVIMTLAAISFQNIKNLFDIAMNEADMLWFLTYIFIMIIDNVLISTMYLKYEFGKTLVSRTVYMLCVFMIPILYKMTGLWFLSFAIAPIVSVMVTLWFIMTGSNDSIDEKVYLGITSKVCHNYLGFFLACLVSQLLVYMDRWIIVAFDNQKSEVAYFTVAIQACSLILFPLEKLSEFIAPQIANMNNIEEMTRKYVFKVMALTLSSMVYVVTFGTLFGYVYFKLFKSTYFEHGWKYFIILIACNSLYPVYIYSRNIIIKFYSNSSLIVPNLVAIILQLSISTWLISLGYKVEAVSIGKGASIVALSLSVLVLLYLPVRKKRKAM